jgi:hypothetical protein
MAASVVATLVLFTVLVAGFSACDKDDDNSEPLYTPSKNMTQAEILSFFKEVDDNMDLVRVVSIEEIEKDNTSSGIEKTVVQFNADTKKELVERYYDKGKGLILGFFRYAEGSTKYEYENEDYSKSGKVVQLSYKISDIYWNQQLSDEFPRLGESSNVEWKIEGNSFVTNYTVGEGTEVEPRKVTVAITASKKIANFKREGSYTEHGENISYTEETKYTYSANPAMPSGFNVSNFSLAEQYYLKVVWGGTLGESIIYTEPENPYIDLKYDIIDLAHKVAGKTPELYRDAGFSEDQKVESYSSIRLEDNSIVLYAKWVDAPADESKASLAAKPLFKKLKRKP